MTCSRIHHRIAMVGLLYTVLIGSNLVEAQPGSTVTVTPAQVNLVNVPSGGTGTQTVNVSVTGTSAVVINTSNLPSWMQVTPSGSVNVTPGTPVTLTVTANPPAGLTPGTYDTSFSVGTQDSANPQTVVVTTFVSGKSVLSASPSSLSFTSLPGSNQASPAVASVKISSSGSLMEFSATASTVNGQNWLIPLTVSGATGSSSVPATPLLVSVNPAGLASGTYLGQILVQSTNSQDSVTIAVSLTVGPNTLLSVTPPTLQPFFFQSNSANFPVAQQLTVTSSSSPANFTIALNPPVPWLMASVAPATSTPGGGSSSAITLLAAPLQNVGLFTTSLVITNGTSQISIPVSYAVGIGQVPQVTPNQLSFTSSASQIPASQTVQVSLPSLGNPVGFTVGTDSSWLRASASGQSTPATLTVTAIPTGLAAGTYTGHVTVQPTNGDLYAVPVPVTLTVTGAPTLLTSGPPVLLFSNQIGQAAPGAQVLQLNSNGQVLSYTTATASTTAPNCSANWLKVSALSANPTTPSALAVTIDPTGLTAGICSGTVTLNYGTAGTSGTIGSIQVPVIVETSANPLVSLNVPPGFGFETAATCSTANGTGSPGSGTASVASCPVIIRQIALSSTDGITPLSFVATAANSGTTPWLFVSPNSGQTPTALTVLIVPENLPPGNYNGAINISSTSSNSAGLPLPIAIPITLTVGSNVTVTATPSTLNFTQTAGGSLPASQTITLNSSAPGATYTAFVPNSANCGWVKVSPMSGAATGSITVSITANSLTANSYSCPVTLMLNGASTQAIPFTANLTVSAAQGGGQSLTVAPQTLTFASSSATPQPASQQLSITAASGSGAFSVTSTSSGWLSVTPAQGTAPATITVSVNPQSVGSRTSPFTGSITITPTDGGTPISVPVTLTVASSTGSNPTVTATPTTLNFTQTAGGSVPAAQTVTLTSSATGATFNASIPSSTNCGWVQVAPMSGPATGKITVTVLSNSLAANAYTCPITLTLTGASTQSIPITANLTVNSGQGQGQSLTVSPQALTFLYSTSVPQPASQQLTITMSGTGSSTPANFSAVATSSGWLSVTPSQGTTPGSLTVSVSLQSVGFGSGPLTGTITVTPSGGGTPITVPVTLMHQ